jgi:hypothetical protein
MVYKIKNPKTGKLIKKHGAIHNKLIEEGIDLSKEKSVRKRKFKANEKEDKEHLKNLEINKSFKVDKSNVSWKDKKPHTKKERKDVMEKCGKDCFLIPSRNKFPICNKITDKNSECSYNCKGLKAASSRAGEWGYKTVLKTSKRLTKELDCYKGKSKKNETVKKNEIMTKTSRKEKSNTKKDAKSNTKKDAKSNTKKDAKSQKSEKSGFSKFLDFIFG